MTAGGEVLNYRGMLAGDLARLFDLWWTPQFRSGLVGDASSGLGNTDVRLVWELAVRGPMRPGALAALLDVGAPAATKSVGRLRARRLVAVEDDPNDGRAQLVRLTGEGRDFAQKLIEVGDVMISQITAQWDANDVAALTRLTSRFLGDAVRYAERLPSRSDPRRAEGFNQ